MLRLLLLLLALAVAAPAAAQLGTARINAIQPELVAEGRAIPGGEVELAIVMHTRAGLARLLAQSGRRRPADAASNGSLPAGASVGPLRYPVPTRLIVAGLMNYVYERDHAILARLKVPARASGHAADSRRGCTGWPAPTRSACPNRARCRSTCRSGGARDRATRASTSGAGRCRARWPARRRFARERRPDRGRGPAAGRSRIGEPYFFPADDGAGRLCRAAASAAMATR